ncbi:putative gustatory receptor 22d [Rhagoletis pomonella]|uniref:putative gustatory receptor 22d n=1 Tax=Rhagoletis pomonella TaxID=28610 RepID=UPI00177F1231|nr:putative gustatory receptor 22d [Rhagoletis pomonella]
MHTFQSGRRKLANFLEYATFELSFIFGLLPFKHDNRTGKFRSSRAALIYSCLLNSIIFFCCTKYLPDISNDELFIQNSLLILIDNTMSYIKHGAWAIIFYKIWTGKHLLLRLYREMASIKKMCFKMAFICNFGSSSSTKDKRIIWKFILMVLDIIFFLITMLTSDFKKDYLYIFLITCGVVILTEIDLIMNQFYHNVLYINDVVTAINNQLRSLRTSKHLAASKINELFCVYIRLMRLTANLMAAYEHQLFIIISCRLFITVQKISQICLTFGGKELHSNTMGVMFILHIVFSFLLKHWTFMNACESVLRSQQQTEAELRKFNNLCILNADLSKELNTFTIFCAIHRFRFPLCGMVEINFITARNLCTLVLTALLWLIQFQLVTNKVGH